MIFSRNRSYVITRDILSDFCCVSFSTIRSVLSSKSVFSRCLMISDRWYICFLKLCFNLLRLLFKSASFEPICLILMASLRYLSGTLGDIFQDLRMQYNFTKLRNQILLIEVFRWVIVESISSPNREHTIYVSEICYWFSFN